MFQFGANCLACFSMAHPLFRSDLALRNTQISGRLDWTSPNFSGREWTGSCFREKRARVWKIKLENQKQLGLPEVPPLLASTRMPAPRRQLVLYCCSSLARAGSRLARKGQESC